MNEVSNAAAGANSNRRKRALTALAAVVALGGIAWGVYEWRVGSRFESTDNAYVKGNVVQITPQVGGTVMSILADETGTVKAGQPLVQLDPADARVALEQAEANLGQTVRQVSTLYANNGSLAAQVSLRNAEVARAQTELARASSDMNRRQALVNEGAVSGEEWAHVQQQVAGARSALSAAEAGVLAAREQLASNRAMTDGTAVDQHPSVLAAAAHVREAWLAVQRATVPAPVDGQVAQRTVQLGQRVAAGTPLMSVVPLNQLWVEANFKEGQLRQIRVGQPVKLTADVYGRKVEYRGTVEGLGAGTGAAFSLLPAQNATGNWIKVVQRVPVRIALDPHQVAQNPLRVGLSMDCEVDVGRQDGARLAAAPQPAATAQTRVYDTLAHGADAEVHRVIASNLGHALPPTAAGDAAPAGAATLRARAPAPATTAHRI